MRKWSFRKVLIHAALDWRNPIGVLLKDKFIHRCSRGQDLFFLKRFGFWIWLPHLSEMAGAWRDIRPV